MASLQLTPLSTRTDHLSLPDIKVFRCRKPLTVRCSAGESTTDFDAKVFWQLAISFSSNFGFQREAVDYGVHKLWENNNVGKRYEDISVLGQRPTDE